MLNIRDVTRRYGSVDVLRGITLEIEQGEIICLLGPSGCGKTTLLRIIAGLEQASSGDILLEGQSILNTPIHERDFGLMFQDFALFPHMNVGENVRFGLRMRNIPREIADRRVREALALVGMEGFINRDVAQLSGGERQRVALARSLAPEPRLLMLDEPMGSLDAALRERLVVELREIIKAIGLTAIYVTHDQQEAYATADRIAIMNAGQIEQVDTPERIYHKPRTAFAARFLGFTNLVPVIRQTGEGAETALGVFNITEPASMVLLHPDGLTIVPRETPGAIAGQVRECVFRGGRYDISVVHASGLILRFEQPTRPDNERIGILIHHDFVIPLQ